LISPISVRSVLFPLKMCFHPAWDDVDLTAEIDNECTAGEIRELIKSVATISVEGCQTLVYGRSVDV